MTPASPTAPIELVDLELRAFLDQWPLKALDETNLTDMRAVMEQMAAQFAQQSTPGILCEERFIQGAGEAQPEVRALLYRPEEPIDGKRPAILHVHGGGYVLGKPEINRARAEAAVENHGCVVLSPAYRLAPETKFPGALEDLYICLKWLHDNADDLHVDRERIVVLGESAGGGLAAALVIFARDQEEIDIAGQVLIYPMLDDKTGTVDTAGAFVGDFIWTAEMNRFGWQSYLPEEPGTSCVNPYAAAARVEDISGLPPAFILTGALDLLLDENLDYARRLIRAGVPTGMHVFPGAFHAFDLAGDAQISKHFANSLDAAIASLFGSPAYR